MRPLAVILTYSLLKDAGFYVCPQTDGDIELDIEVAVLEYVRPLVKTQHVVVAVLPPNQPLELELINASRLANRLMAQISAMHNEGLDITLQLVGKRNLLGLAQFGRRLQELVNNVEVLKDSTVIAMP